MEVRSIRRTGYLIAGLFAVACSDAPTGAKMFSAAPDAAETLDSLAASANNAGNVANAASYATGAEAIRRGIQPSEILVSVGGEIGRYKALVIGTVETLSPGDTAIRRHLIAWSGDDRIAAVLDVTTLADVGSFSSEFEPASDPRSRAQGVWLDLVRDSRWIATTGTAGLTLVPTGEDCQSERLGDRRCVLATSEVVIDGLFRLHGAAPDDGAPAVRIQVNERDVSGIILSGGSSGRPGPTAQPGRPVQTGGRGR